MKGTEPISPLPLEAGEAALEDATIGILEHELLRRPRFEALLLSIGLTDLSPAGLTAELTDAILDLVLTNRGELVVVDFSKVAYCGATAFTLLLKIHKCSKQHNKALSVAGLGPLLETSYRLCMLQRIIPLSNTVEQALDAYETEAKQNVTVA